MASQVKTEFIVTGFDDYIAKTERAGRSLDSLSDISRKSTLGSDFKNLTNDIRTSLTNAEKSVASLKTTTEKVSIKPTISRYWQNEEAEVKKSVSEIRRATDSVSFPSPGNPGKASLDRLTGNSGGGARSNPLIDTEKLYGASRFNDVAAFTKIGNEAEKATVKVAKLRRGTTEFQRTLLELTDDLAPRGFNRPFNSVGRELFGRFNAAQAAGEAGNGAARLAALTRVKETGLAVTKAEAIATSAAAAADLGSAAAKGTATAASVSLTAAKSAETAATKALTIAETESVATFAGISLAGAAVIGAFAVAGLAIVKVTGDIRKEAERRLKLENDISGAINKQILGQKEALANFAQLRLDAGAARDFSKSLETNSPEQLQAKRATALKLLSLSAAGADGKPTETANRLNKEILDIDARLYAIREKRAKDADEAFSQRNENFKKEQESNFKREETNAEKAKVALEKRVADLKKANHLILEIGKNASNAFESLSGQINKDNPFVAAFTEAEKASKSLYENIKALPPELQKVATEMQGVVNSTKLFETRLNNALDAQNLRDEADNFRNPKSDTLVDKRRFDEIVQQNISQGNFFNGNFGNYGSNVANQAGGFDKLTDAQKRDIYEVATLSNAINAGNDPNNFVGFLARERGNVGKNEADVNFQERLDRKIDIITGSNPQNEAEKISAERALISLTQGLDPSKLTDRERDVAATARENEAMRREQAEANAQKERIAQTALQTQIVAYQKTLTEQAAKGGSSAVEVIIKDQSEAGVEAKKAAKTATPADAANYYNDKNASTYLNDSQRNF